MEELVSSIPSRTFLRKCFRVIRQSNKRQQLFRQEKLRPNIGMKAIDVGKTVAIDAGKKLVEKPANRLTTPKPQVANVIVPPEEITKKGNEVIAKYVDTSEINLNKLVDGASVTRSNTSNAVAIQDLVRRINGSGLKVTYIFFSSSIKNDGRYIKIYRFPNY